MCVCVRERERERERDCVCARMCGLVLACLVEFAIDHLMVLKINSEEGRRDQYTQKYSKDNGRVGVFIDYALQRVINK